MVLLNLSADELILSVSPIGKTAPFLGPLIFLILLLHLSSLIFFHLHLPHRPPSPHPSLCNSSFLNLIQPLPYLFPTPCLSVYPLRFELLVPPAGSAVWEGSDIFWRGPLVEEVHCSMGARCLYRLAHFCSITADTV